MDANLLAILVCPHCKGKLEHHARARQLICRAEKLAFPISEEGVPILLLSEAVELDAVPPAESDAAANCGDD